MKKIPNNLDVHFAPQVTSIVPDKIKYDFMLKLERIDEEILDLNKILGTKISFDTNKKVTNAKKFGLETNHLNFGNEFYAEDFKALNYKKLNPIINGLRGIFRKRRITFGLE